MTDSRPVPDPTELTTDALHREIGALEKLIDTKLESVHILIVDLKDRVTILESVKQVEQKTETILESIKKVEQKTETRQVGAGMIAAIGIGITILLVVLAVIGYIAGTVT